MNYVDTENPRYKYVVGRTLNEFAVMILVLSTGERLPLNKAIADRNDIQLPDGVKLHHSQQAPVQRELDRIAKLNRLTPCQ